MNRRFAISILFLVHGLIEAAWVSRIPGIQVQLHADTGALGIALLGSAVGAIVAMPLTGWLLAKWDNRTVTLAAVLGHCAALPLMALATSVTALLAALTLYGAAGGAADVSINAAGSALDKTARRPVMSSFHALYSLGGMLGAAIGVFAVKLGTPIPWHLMAVAAVLAIAAISVMPGVPSTLPEKGSSAFAMPPRKLFAIGALAFCILFGERAMADWTGIYLVGLGSTASFAAYGFAAFSGAMTIGRFGGDAMVHRFGAATLVRWSSAIAALGLAVALAYGTPVAGLWGFASVGLGFSVVVPILFRAGGQTEGIAPGLGIAAVTTMGYSGFLLGPPLVGLAARATSLRFALFSVVLLSAVVSLLAKRALR